MVDAGSKLLTPPSDPNAHLEALHTAFVAGDLIALFQAIEYAQVQNMTCPSWVAKPLENTLIGVVTKKSGSAGKGNSAFGDLQKSYVRTVRASAYHYIRAWQKDPHRYHDLPRRTFEAWCASDISWHAFRKAINASRLVSTSLDGTVFDAKASTLQRTANKFPTPIRWGRAEAEEKLGLRGPSGIFGPPPCHELPPHIQTLLAKRIPKP